MNKILTITANPAVDRVYFVEDFKIGEVHRPVKNVFSAGGKGINVSRVCKLLDADIIATGFLGGYMGDYIRSQLKNLDINDCFTQINGETRICINISDKNGVSSEILEGGPIITAYEKERFIESFKERILDCEIITVSGSLPQGLNSDFYITIADIAKEYNKRIIFDTSGKALEDVIENKPFMVKPNKDEFLKLAGWSDFDPKRALMFLKDKGVEVPFVSLGKDGAVAIINQKFYKFSVPTIDVVNTVGSGDSTIAGIAVGISKGMSICDSIVLGMAAGVSNSLFETTGFVTKDTVKEFYKKIEVTCL